MANTTLFFSFPCFFILISPRITRVVCCVWAEFEKPEGRLIKDVCFLCYMEVGEDGWALRMPTGKNLGSLNVVRGEGKGNIVI